MTALVLPDSNVFFSRTLRDWTFLLSQSTRSAIYAVHTTSDIIAETIAKIRDKNLLIAGQSIAAIETTVRDSVTSVFSDYAPEPQDLIYDWISDNGDYHVHAAATQGGIDYLVTQDRGFFDLPEEVQMSLSYEIHSADSFFCLVDDSAPTHVEMVTLQQLSYWAGKQRTILSSMQICHVPSHDLDAQNSQTVSAIISAIRSTCQPPGRPINGSPSSCHN